MEFDNKKHGISASEMMYIVRAGHSQIALTRAKVHGCLFFPVLPVRGVHPMGGGKRTAILHRNLRERIKSGINQ